MTEVTFKCSAEKAAFLLKASRMFDGGYTDFINLERVVEKIIQQVDVSEQLCKESCEKGDTESRYMHAGREAGYIGAKRIIEEEVG